MRLRRKESAAEAKEKKSKPWRWLAIVPVVILVPFFVIYAGNTQALASSMWFYVGLAVSVLSTCLAVLGELRNRKN